VMMVNFFDNTSIKRNLAALAKVTSIWLGSILASGLTFLSQVLFARALGPADLGELTSSLSIAGFLITVSTLGIAQFWLRIFAQEGSIAKRWLTISFKLVGISSIITIALFFLINFALLDNKPETIILVVLLSFYIFGQIAFELTSAKFQLEGRYFVLSFWQMTPHLMRFLLIVLVSTFFFVNLPAVGVIYAMEGLAVLLIAVVEFNKLLKGQFILANQSPTDKTGLSNPYSSEKPTIVQLLHNALPFGLVGLFFTIFNSSAIVLIRMMLNSYEAGLFSVAFIFISGANLFPFAVYQKFLLPKVQSWAYHDQQKFSLVFKYGEIIMFLCGCIFVLVIWLTSNWLIPNLFGVGFVKSVQVLQLLSLSIPFFFVANNAGVVLATKDNINLKARILMGSALSSVLFCVIGIKIAGVEGAAIGYFAANLVYCFMYAFYARKIVNKELSKK